MILRLQQQSGNQAVQRLLSNGRSVQRKAAGRSGGELDAGLQSQIEGARDGGQALDKQAASTFGEKLGADFSGVRIHTDAQADTLSRSLNATAFTTSNDIFFSKGAYNPSSSSGQRLLAHELTHVVQQGGSKANKVQTKLKVGAAHDGFEKEASRAALAMNDPHSARSTQSALSHSMPDVIQRNVGFEFEVPLYSAYQLTEPMTNREKKGEDTIAPNKLSKKGMYKGERLASGKGFELQVDESNLGSFNLEFVTQDGGFPETEKGRDQFKKALSNMQNLGEQIRKKTIKKSGPRLEDNKTRLVDTKEIKGGVSPISEILIQGDGKAMAATPQATLGIRLDQLPNFIAKMTGRLKQKENKNRIKQNNHINPFLFVTTNLPEVKAINSATVSARQAIEEFKKQANIEELFLPDKFGSSALVGLIALIYTYLKKADATEVKDYPKSLFPLLGRTNFAVMFGMLPDDDQIPFLKSPKLFAKINLDAAEMPNTDETPFFTKGFGPQLTNMTQEETKNTAEVLGKVTRGEWLTRIPGKVDVLTQEYTKIRALESMGKFTRGDEVGQESKEKKDNTRSTAPILELRRMGNDLPISDWYDFALQMYDFIVELNDLKFEEETDTN